MLITSIRSHGEVDSEPKEIYGDVNAGVNPRIVLRIGNGGAGKILCIGATGLLRPLAEAFQRSYPATGRISWVQNHSRNTQLALLQGHIDLALTYERNQELISVEEGWAIAAGCAFHDHFVLAGPVNDPAGVATAASLTDALKRIRRIECAFHSRGDTSATMWKERDLWSEAGVEPWVENHDSPWYIVSMSSPAEALVNADKARAYLITDRSTLLRQTINQTIHNTTVFFEPRSENDVLMNSCVALYSPNASSESGAEVQQFLRFLFSEDGQKIVASFGVEEAGLQLFAPVKDGFSRAFLRGGMPKDGKWVPMPV